MTTSRWRRALVVLLPMACVLLTACGGGKSEPDPALTPARRDSVLSESALPGAGAVKGALGVADSARVRAERADEAGHN